MSELPDNKIAKPRGRPRKFTKEYGVKTAKALFHQSGFEGVSIADICEEIGVPPTSIYSSFGSKFELFCLAIKSDSNHLQDRLDAVLQSSQNVEEVFRACLEFAVQQFTENPTTPGCFLLDAALFIRDQKVRELVLRETQLLQEIISNRLEEIRVLSGSEIASSIVTLMGGLSNDARMGASQEQLFITSEFYCSAFDC
jgi:TetR/AcrR family transcriptional repressor for divergent bdcA